MGDDLVAFLRARLDEDEQVARGAEELGARWVRGNPSGVWRSDDPHGYGPPIVYDEGRPTPEQADHIARHDPARVLAEVQAKRRIIDEHRLWVGEQSDAGRYCSICVGYPIERHEGGHIGVAWPCLTLRLLALPYAEHLDYRPEWAPDTEVNRG